MPQKLYILVKEDLSPAQKAVQACHAVQLWTWDANKHDAAAVQTKVLCEVDNATFDIQVRRLKQRGIDYSIWREPDMDNRSTALACLHDGNLFSDLKMME